MSTVAAELQVNVGADVSGALSGLGKVNRGFSDTLGFLGRAASTALGFGAATLGLDALGNVAGFANEAVFGMNSRLEQSQIAFTTLLGSGERASAFLAQLAAFANTTPFSFADVTQAAQRFLAVGIAAQDVVPLLTDVSDAASAFGSGSEGIQAISRALLQMKGIGIVQMGELNQLSEQGINGFRILAAATGKSTQQIRKEIQGGQISADLFIAAFQQFARQQWGGQTAAQATTFKGAMSTVKDTLTMGLASAFFPLFELLREGTVNLAAFLQTQPFVEWVSGVRAGVAEALQIFGTLAVMAGNIARDHNLNPFAALATTAEIFLGQKFGPKTAETFHGLLAGIQTAGQWIVTNGPRFFAWLANDAPGQIEAGIGKLRELRDWLNVTLPPAVEQVKAAFADIGQTVADQFTLARGQVVGFLEFLAGIPLLGEPFRGIAAQTRTEFESFLRAQGLTPPALATPVAAATGGGAGPLAQRLGAGGVGVTAAGLPAGLPTFSQQNPTAITHNAPVVQIDRVDASNPADVDALIDALITAVQVGQQRAENRASTDLPGAG